jgi:hypothetical protein
MDTIALAGGRIFYVDPAAGADGNSGRDPDAALLTIQAAHDLTTTAKNDIIVLIAAATANEPAATIAWDHTYTHMVGACAPLIMGQRARVVGTAALDLNPVVAISGRGCYFANIKFNNDKDSNDASGCVKVTSADNYFKSCEFNITSATLLARTDTYSLWMSTGASECVFDRCTFGTDTADAAGAGYNVLFDGGSSKSYFKDCIFLTRASSSTSRVMCKFDATSVGMGLAAIFDGCTFVNTSTSWGVTMADAFSVTGGNTHYIVVKGNNQIVGITGWADTTTRVYLFNSTTTALGASQTPVA